jgi:hypothetical protein
MNILKQSIGNKAKAFSGHSTKHMQPEFKVSSTPA